MIYTEEQEVAIEAISTFLSSDREVMTVSGAGGTGKTTIVKEVYKGLRGVMGVAVSHSAKGELQKSLGEGVPCLTLASALQLKRKIGANGVISFIPNPYAREAPPISLAKYLVIDECSMLDQEDMDNIMELKSAGTKVLYLGDVAQLPPIARGLKTKGEDSPTFNHIGATLVIPVRYTGPTTELGNALRREILSDRPSNFGINVWQTQELGNKTRTSKVIGDSGYIFINSSEDIKRITKLLIQEHNDDVQMVAYTNKAVDVLNTLAREALYDKPEDQLDTFMPNEKIIAIDSYSIKIREGNTKVLINNNDLFHVKDFVSAKTEDSDEFPILRLNLDPDLNLPEGMYVDCIDPSNKSQYLAKTERLLRVAKSGERNGWDYYYDFKKNWLSWVYSYSITSHKAQGKTYSNSIVIEGDIMSLPSNIVPVKTKLQSLYVACTRAKYITFIYNKQYPVDNSQLPSNIKTFFGL